MSDRVSPTPEPTPSPMRLSGAKARVALAFLILVVAAVVVQRVWLKAPAEEPINQVFAEGHPLPGNTPPVVGQMAPDFEMVYPDGRRVRLSDLRGKPVVVNFWASWCGPCRVEMPELVRVYEAHRSEGLVILAVNLQESAGEVQAFVEEFDMRFPVILDPDGRVADRYQIRSLPSSIFIDRDGMIAARWIGLLTPSMLQKHLERIL